MGKQAQPARDLVQRLYWIPGALDQGLRERIVAAGDAAVPHLIEVIRLVDPGSSLRGTEPTRAGCALLHAVSLLGDMHAVAAIGPLLSLAARADHENGALELEVRWALHSMGPAVVEPLLAFHEAVNDRALRRMALQILASVGASDDRVLALMRGTIAEDVDSAVEIIAYCQDPRLEPDLHELLITIDDPAGRCRLVDEIVDLIARLGGRLSDDEEVLWECALRAMRVDEDGLHRRRRSRHRVARLAELPPGLRQVREAIRNALAVDGPDVRTRLAPASRSWVAALGARAVPWLMEVIEDALADPDEFRGERRRIPGNAATVLADLGIEEAIEPMLNLLEATDWSHCDRISDLVWALARFRERVVEPALARHRAASDRGLRNRIADVLAETKVRDSRIFELLVAMLDSDKELAASMLLDYGDPRAIPIFAAILDADDIQSALLAIVQEASEQWDLGLTERQTRRLASS